MGTATCESHASEWAIFRSMSRDHEGLASTEEVQKMCQNLGGSEHSEVVVRLMDPLKSGRVSFEEFVKPSDIVLAIQRSCRLRQWHRCFGLGVVWNALQVRQGHAGEDVGGVTLCNRPDSVYTFYSPRAAAHQDETRRSRSLQCGRGHAGGPFGPRVVCVPWWGDSSEHHGVPCAELSRVSPSSAGVECS